MVKKTQKNWFNHSLTGGSKLHHTNVRKILETNLNDNHIWCNSQHSVKKIWYSLCCPSWKLLSSKSSALIRLKIFPHPWLIPESLQTFPALHCPSTVVSLQLYASVRLWNPHAQQLGLWKSGCFASSVQTQVLVVSWTRMSSSSLTFDFFKMVLKYSNCSHWTWKALPLQQRCFPSFPSKRVRTLKDYRVCGQFPYSCHYLHNRRNSILPTFYSYYFPPAHILQPAAPQSEALVPLHKSEVNKSQRGTLITSNNLHLHARLHQ